MTAPNARLATARGHAPQAHEPGLVAQWTGLLLAPAVFFAHLQTHYVLVYRACRYHQDIWLHVVGVTAVALAAFGAWTAWRVWAQAGGTAELEPAGPVPRARFLGLTGLGTSALLVLILLGQWLAAFVLSPCQ